MLLIREKNEIELYQLVQAWKKFKSLRSTDPFFDIHDEGYITVIGREDILDKISLLLFSVTNDFSVAKDMCSKCQKNLRR